MDSGRGGREPARGVGNTSAPKAKRKKVRPTPTPTNLDPFRPIPQPYLALAPRPLSSSSSSFHAPTQAQTPIPRSNLVLPSSYRRPATAQGTTSPATFGDAGPSTTRRERDRERMFASGLLAPPTIRAGANTPSGRAISPSGRRRTDRLRTQQGVGMGAGNPSVTSLGHLGRIMESDPQNQGEDRTQTPAPARRRRRIVRAEGEGPGLTRRLTVSSREEGRAIGLARGASMRRLNVWDDVPPENDEPPPPFPFPTSSSSRLPPTFETNESLRNTAPPVPIPNSPPPTFEQATAIQIQAIPEININSPQPIPDESSRSERPSSRASTHYESAPSSPVLTATTNPGEEGERDDRKLWNADLLAGYSLEERVQREFARRESRTQVVEIEEGSLGTASPSPSPLEMEGDGTGSSTSHEAAEDAAVQTETPAVPTTTTGIETTESAVTIQPEEDADLSTVVTETEQEPTTQVDPPIPAVTSLPTAEIASEETEIPHVSSPAAESLDTAAVQEGAASISEHVLEEKAAPDGPVIAKADTESTIVEPTSVEASPNGTDIEKIPAITTKEEDVPKAVQPKLAATHDSSRSLPSLADVQEMEEPVQTAPKQEPPIPTKADPVEEQQSNKGQDREQEAPTRKLTRGKAIRRSSSGLIKSQSPTANSPVVAAPLFSAARFDFGKSPLQVSKPLPIDPTSENGGSRAFVHRASAPEIHSSVKPSTARNETVRAGRRSEDRDIGLKLPGGRRLGDPPLEADLTSDRKGKEGDENGDGDEQEGKSIPPHREAALLRRESILAQLSRPTLAAQTSTSYSNAKAPPWPARPQAPKISKRASFPSGPLIDFSDYDPSIPPHAHHLPEITGLAASNAELLELLEQEASLPQSSSQAANTAQLVEDLRAQLQVVQEEPEDKSRNRTPPPLPARGPLTGTIAPRADLQEIIKKKPPPPPPPLRSKGWTSGQKISIVDTATSPITPRPSIRRPNAANTLVNANTSPTSPIQTKKLPPPLPTRRPPPPPSSGSIEEITDHTPPPLFHRISGRPLSSISATTSNDSIYETSTIGSLPTKKPPIPAPWQNPSPGKFDRSPLKPRGPRPRPPPPPPRPRTWAVIAGERPGNDRTHSEGVLSLASDVGEGSGPTRSNSEMDLTGRTSRRRVAEYTDLDVFVSRLEGSGREYEGFSHIAQFLGPAKSPAASSEALSTLLPGPIAIESRRVTKEGKVKLKLSLLGVRVTKCPICLTQFREGEMGVLLPICGHLGHEECARRWFREDDRCFVCRVRLKVEEGVV